MYYTDFFKGYIKNYFKDSNFSGVYTYEDGTKKWYKKGKLHREDGPAVEYPDGRKEWWIEGKNYSENKFKLLTELSIFLGKEKGKYDLDWLRFLIEEGIEEFPIVPGMEKEKTFKILFDLIK